MAGPASRLLRAFFALNRRACLRVEPWLLQSRATPLGLYEEWVRQFVGERHSGTVLDVGAGKSSFFAKAAAPERGMRVFALDVSGQELLPDQEAAGRVVADTLAGLPFRGSSFDVITSRSVLEHVGDVGKLFEGCRDALRPGGYCVHVFSCRFAPFALINRVLPAAVSRKVVYFFRPETEGICGFSALYDRCYYSAVRELLERNGFEVVFMRPGFYQARYFDFFFPLFALMALYELAVAWMGLNNLSAYLLVVARRRQPSTESG